MTDYRYCDECDISIDHLDEYAEHCEVCAVELAEFLEVTGHVDQEADDD